MRLTEAMDKSKTEDTGSVQGILERMREAVTDLTSHTDNMEDMLIKPRGELDYTTVKEMCVAAAPLYTKCKVLHEDCCFIVQRAELRSDRGRVSQG